MNTNIETQISANIVPGKILSVTLKNGRKINGRFCVWKKYDDKTKFLDIAETSAHYLVYDFKVKDYVVIVKQNIAKIAANKKFIMAA